ERLERDRAIGRELAAGDDLARVLGWWRCVRASSPAPSPTLGARVEAARRLGGVALVVFGLLLGGLVAGVAFAYDGRSPVNLFALLGVLVGLPLLLLAFTLLLLPGRLPGLGAVQSVAAGMNLGRWIGAWMDRLLGAELFAPQLLSSGSASTFSRWQLVVFSQWLALGFFAGALTVALLRVTFTDLAFGWGTTLRMEPSTVHAWVNAASAPWAPWLPQAVPDAALVEASRIYRLEEARLPPERVQLLGRWWPFVLMTMLVYGALPRLLLLLIGVWRLRRATRALLLDDPEVTALRDRLDAPLVAQSGSADEEQLQADREGLAGPREPVAAEGLVLMIWNRAVSADRARAWLVEAMGVEPAAHAELGILQSEDQQRAILAALQQQVKPAVRRVLVVTKGWEPPLLEFMDFLGLVRETLSGEASVTVVPLALSGDQVHDDEREVWARALARLRDPRLYVMEAAV
ncbi:MAG: DUF2868 domain-containing protein, partial [Pseudomonadales bacterium]